MRLSFETIQDCTCGAVRCENAEQGIRFYRFTPEQIEVYRNTNYDGKSYAASGIRLRFITDSEELRLSGQTEPGSSRNYFSFDVLKDGVYLANLSNTQEPEALQGNPKLSLPMGEFSETFSLGKGEKIIEIQFPWSVSVCLKGLSLSEGAFVRPVPRKKKLLLFGDSITQGYDAFHPHNRYGANLADFLEAEEYNKAIGGEMFNPKLAACKDGFQPDYVVCACGTNDWNRITREEFRENAEAFLSSLAKHYPSVQKVVLSPIWRADCEEERTFGAFSQVEEELFDIAKQHGFLTVSGKELLPKQTELFLDGYLHPNDKGFEYYKEAVIRAFQNIKQK